MPKQPKNNPTAADEVNNPVSEVVLPGDPEQGTVFEGVAASEPGETFELVDARSPEGKQLAAGVDLTRVPTLAITRFPQHMKLQAVKDKSQTIHDFVEWLGNTKKIHLGEFHKDRGRNSREVFGFTHASMRSLLEEFFDVDGDALALEKAQMIEDLRAVQQESDGGNSN